ncbi:MAG: hypothetical protein QG663_1113, partial [Thermodesulfobacteriota bacterium]|nr:hypothetical protein [Thermodesulfobacteriota bacterium]
MATKYIAKANDVIDILPRLRRTLLPPFPNYKMISTVLPEFAATLDKFGKAGFGPWIAFTLENPDEIWD